MSEQEAVPAFTPGPWLADVHNEQRDGGRFIVYVRGANQLVPIAAVPTGVEGYGREEGRATAALIAAAPDMYAALRLFLAYDAGTEVDGVKLMLNYNAAIEAARAALSKATPHV